MHFLRKKVESKCKKIDSQIFSLKVANIKDGQIFGFSDDFRYPYPSLTLSRTKLEAEFNWSLSNTCVQFGPSLLESNI